jgi:L-ascorbate metabolism protein UlaG (beta-lactamase superfamily)
MIVSYQGMESFKISQGELVVAVNPKAKTAADITLFSTGKGDTSDKSGFVISGPGEYEVKDISVKGFLSEGEKDPSTGSGRVNTIYMINFEGMNLCFLGTLGPTELAPETLESLEDIDLLFAPVSAYKLAVSLEPRVIIPMNYTPDSLKKFLKEVGEDSIPPMDKLVIKKKDLEGKEGDIIVLKEE